MLSLTANTQMDSLQKKPFERVFKIVRRTLIMREL